MVKNIINSASKFAVTTLGFSNPVSTALNNILLALIVLLWLAGRDFKTKLAVIRDNKFIWSIFILVGLYFAGLFYGDANIAEAANDFLKFASLLLIPMMIPFFKDEKTRNNALNVFLLTMTVLLFLSYLMWTGLLPENEYFKGDQESPIIFLKKITHSLLMAFSAFVVALRVRQNPNWKMKLLFVVLTLLFVFNVAVMVGGKTGYFVLMVLTIYYFYDWLGWKGFLPAVLAIAIFGMFTYLNPSSGMHNRSKKFINDISEANIVDWRLSEVKKGSTGLRISFYKNTLKIIIEHPLFGVGTGGYPKAYSQIIKNTEMPSTVNPHNEYLMVTAQLGLLGLCAFLFMFLMQWCLASNLHSKYDKIIARGLVLTIMAASMVSSTIIDLHERTFYIWMSALLFGGYVSCRCSEGNKETVSNKAISE